MTQLQSDPRLLEALAAAVKRPPSAAQLHRQRVSYIAGALSDDKTKVTDEMVERELRRMEGTAA
ncbi:hypothetical protein LAZ29_12185 [Cereibacter sphaeroides]|uniref:hypothetical protein n=1 Tax=Cereibacter sphaeroides TaxID=1063 RepID=UPI001F2A58D1|nr:hypothetical protein [Cereibacter sphaeroides]MCE6951686.1 hypothetical protein [Cereibacter sphaeroides]